MAIVGNYTQQPNDQLDYDIPYTLASTDSLINVAISGVTPTTDPPLTASSTIVGKRVKLWIGDGLAGTTYKVTYKVTTDEGREKEDELKIRVKDY